MSIDRSEIGANIRNYIELNKALQIDGVGCLIKSTSNCSMNDHSHFLFPGEENIVLHELSGLSNAEFINYLAESQEISLDLARKNFSQFCLDIANDINQFGKCKIFDLGQFYSKDGELKFVEISHRQTGEFYGLPALSLQPLAKAKILPQKSEVKTIEIKDLAKDRTDRNFLLKVAGIAAIFVIAMFTYHNYNSPQVHELTGIEIDQSRLNKDPEMVLVSEDLNEETSAELIPGNIEKAEEVASCALIIGSFAKKSNAVDMQAKVLAAGFQLYTEEFHEFYRVGISIECSEIKGESFRQIEEALGVDPWLRIAR